MYRKRTKITIVLTLALAAILFFTGCAKNDSITIGSKDFGENIVIAEMLSQLVETHTDLKVNRKLNLGGTFVNFNAIKNNLIRRKLREQDGYLRAPTGTDVDRPAHNPKVAGSNPAPATKEKHQLRGPAASTAGPLRCARSGTSYNISTTDCTSGRNPEVTSAQATWCTGIWRP